MVLSQIHCPERVLSGHSSPTFQITWPGSSTVTPPYQWRQPRTNGGSLCIFMCIFMYFCLYWFIMNPRFFCSTPKLTNLCFHRAQFYFIKAKTKTPSFIIICMILSTCVYDPGVTVYVSQWRHIPLSFYSIVMARSPKGPVAWDGFRLSVSSRLERKYLELFCVWPNVHRTRYGPIQPIFGSIEEYVNDNKHGRMRVDWKQAHSHKAPNEINHVLPRLTMGQMQSNFLF
jgi:hypothetical protein